MNKDMTCPECGTKLIKERFGHSAVYTCPKCGCSAATTEFDPIDLDETQYVIRLAEGTAVSKETLSLVSYLTGKNFIDSKKVIENRDIIFAGQAHDILRKKDYLSKQGVTFVIEPDFPY